MLLEIKKMANPLQNYSQVVATNNLRLLKTGISHPFTIFNERAKLLIEIISDKLPWLVKTEEALDNFGRMLDEIGGSEGLYINLWQAPNRTPSGYIADMRVIILDSNRELEYRIYDAFRELLKTSSPLLFDLHIIKLRGRRPEEVIPKGFWRYE